MSIGPVRNPLHCLIDLLAAYERAFLLVHQANTTEGRQQALNEWRACHPLAWQDRKSRDDVIRGFADPAKAWLAKRNSRHIGREDFALVEECAVVVSGFAVSGSPMSMPEVYSTFHTSREEQWGEWNRQGERHSHLVSLIQRLRELVARAGDAWQSNADSGKGSAMSESPFDLDKFLADGLLADAHADESNRRESLAWELRG
jgi:hypothetical protein